MRGASRQLPEELSESYLESIEGAGGSCVESLEEAVWSTSLPLSGELPGICAESLQAAVWRACREFPGGLPYAHPAASHTVPLAVLPASDLPARAERAPMLGTLEYSLRN